MSDLSMKKSLEHQYYVTEREVSDDNYSLLSAPSTHEHQPAPKRSKLARFARWLEGPASSRPRHADMPFQARTMLSTL